jgi:MFS family permease
MSLRTVLFERLQHRLFYGWVVLGVATLVLFASGPGQSHTFSVFVGPISADLGISATAIASAYAFATLIAALGLPYMGRLVDRFGPRLMLIGVAALLGVACIGFGAAAGVITLSLGFMALRFLGQGSIMLGSTNLVAQWFSARRGFAMSILMLGFAGSIAVHPLLAQWLIEQVGWRGAWVWLGVMTWVLLLPVLWLVAHDKPEPLGLRPDGEKQETAEEQARGPRALAGLTLAAAMRTQAFWIIAAGLFIPAMLITSLFFFQVSVFESHGLDRALAASMFGLSALAMALAMPAVGWVLDRTDPKYVFSASLVLLAVSLTGISLVVGPLTATAYAVCFGINTAANMTFFGYMWAQYFGRRHLGSIQGAGQTIGVVGASVGPLPLGIAFDQFGSYDGALRLLALLPLACAVLALFLKAPDLSAARDEET